MEHVLQAVFIENEWRIWLRRASVSLGTVQVCELLTRSPSTAATYNLVKFEAYVRRMEGHSGSAMSAESVAVNRASMCLEGIIQHCNIPSNEQETYRSGNMISRSRCTPLIRRGSNEEYLEVLSPSRSSSSASLDGMTEGGSESTTSNIIKWSRDDVEAESVSPRCESALVLPGNA